MPNALTRYTSSRNSPAKCVAFHLGREAGKQRPFHFHHGGAKQQPAWHGKPSVAVPCYVTPCGLAAALAGSSSDAPRGHGLLGCHRHLPQCRSALLLDRPVPGFVGSVRSSPELSGPGNARAVAAGRHFGSLAGSRCLGSLLAGQAAFASDFGGQEPESNMAGSCPGGYEPNTSSRCQAPRPPINQLESHDTKPSPSV
jgi:hypothetical protein